MLCASNRLKFVGKSLGTLSWKNSANKMFKRDSQRVAFLLCVGLSD